MHPGPINNKTILDENEEMKSHLHESYDFICLPKDAYEMLEKNYGGGPKIPRNVISYTNAYGISSYSVEVYPIRVSISTETDGVMTAKSLHLSRVLTFEQAANKIYELLGLVAEDCRFWIAAKKEVDYSYSMKPTTPQRIINNAFLEKHNGWQLFQVMPTAKLSEFGYNGVSLFAEKKLNDSWQWDKVRLE